MTPRRPPPSSAATSARLSAPPATLNRRCGCETFLRASLFRARFLAQAFSLSRLVRTEEKQPTLERAFLDRWRARANSIRRCTIRNHAHRLEMDSPTTTTTAAIAKRTTITITDERAIVAKLHLFARPSSTIRRPIASAATWLELCSCAPRRAG